MTIETRNMQEMIANASSLMMTAVVLLHNSGKIDDEEMRDAINRNLALTRQLLVADGAVPVSSWEDFSAKGIALAESLSDKVWQISNILEGK